MRTDRLTDAELALLTAGVDGELTRREAAALRRLLAGRKEASALFEQLRADAAGVRALTAAPVPPGLVAAVMARLPLAVPAAPRYRPARRQAWLPAAVAAALLFTVSSASYWFFAVRDQSAMAAAVHEQLPAVAPATPATEPDRESVVLAKSKPGPRVPRQPGKPGPELDPTDVVAVAPKASELAPVPRPAEADLLGGGLLGHVKPLTGAEVRLNPLLDAADLGALDVQAMLVREFGREPAFRLDLFAKQPAAGFEAFQKACKAAGVSVAVDARARDMVARKQPGAVAVYTEALTPAEVAALLAELAKHVGGSSPPAIGRAHLIPAGTTEAKDAKELFGIEPPAKPQRGAADPKPLSADTLPKVANAVRKNDKPALAVAYLPAAARTAANQSKEVKDFLARKGDRRPGTVAFLFVIR